MPRPVPQFVEPPPPVRLLLSGDIALVTIDHAPVNALSEQVRIHLRKCVQDASENAQVKFIVLMASKGSHCFSSGADIKEFNHMTPPYLPDVLNDIESSRKVIIAAIDGPALGGGLELCMACHYRLATSRATFALPEVKLGILPGAGGTQRLPRLTGVRKAVEWICSGRTVSAAEALVSGVLDQCLDVDILAEASSSSSSSDDDDSDDTTTTTNRSDDDTTTTSTTSSSSSSSSTDSDSDDDDPPTREDLIWTHLLGAAISFGNKLISDDKMRVITNRGPPQQPLLRRTSALTAQLGNRFARAAFLHVAQRAVASQTPPGMVSPLLALSAIRDGLAAGDFKSGLKKERDALVKAMSTPQSAALRHIFFATRDIYQLPTALKIDSRVARRRASSAFNASGTAWPLSPLKAPMNSSRRGRNPATEFIVGDELTSSVRSDFRSPPMSPQTPSKSSRATRRASLSRASSMAHAGPHAPPAGFINMRRIAVFGHTRRVLRLTAAFLMNGLHVTIVPVALFGAPDAGGETAEAAFTSRIAPGRHADDDDVEVPEDEIEAFLLECLKPGSRDAAEKLETVLQDMSFMTPTMLVRLGKTISRIVTDPAEMLLQQRARVMRNVEDELIELDEVDVFIMLRPALLASHSARVSLSHVQEQVSQYNMSIRTMLVRLEGIARSHAVFVLESRDDVRAALGSFSPFRLDRVFQLFTYPVPAVKTSRLTHHPVEPAAALKGTIWELQGVAAIPSSTAVEAILRFAKTTKVVMVITRMNTPALGEKEEEAGVMEASGVWSREPSCSTYGVTPVSAVQPTLPLGVTEVLSAGSDGNNNNNSLDINTTTTANSNGLGSSDSESLPPAALPPPLPHHPPSHTFHIRSSPTPERHHESSPDTTPLPDSIRATNRPPFTPPPILSATSQHSASAFLEPVVDPRSLACRERCSPIGLRLFARAVFQLLVLIETEQATVDDVEAALRGMGFAHGALLTLQCLGLEEVWEEICFQQSVLAATRRDATTPPTVPVQTQPSSSSSAESPLVAGLTQLPVDDAATAAADGDLEDTPDKLAVPSLPVVSALFQWMITECYTPTTVVPSPSTTASSSSAPVRGFYRAVVTRTPVGPVEAPFNAATRNASQAAAASPAKACRNGTSSPSSSSSSPNHSDGDATCTPAPSPRASPTPDELPLGAPAESSGPIPLLQDTAADQQRAVANAVPEPEMEYRVTTKMVLDERVHAKLKALRQAHAATRGAKSVRRPAPLDRVSIQRSFLYPMLDELMVVQRFNGIRNPRVLNQLTEAEQQVYRDAPRMLALRSADLDVLTVQAFGFPAWYGGLAYTATEPEFCSLFVAFRFLTDRHREELRRATSSSDGVAAGHWTVHPSPALKMSMLVPAREMWTGRAREKERRPTVSFSTAKADVWT